MAKYLKKKLSYALLAGALLYTVRTPRRWLKAHLRERIILAGPIWAACENAYAHVGFKKILETENLTNKKHTITKKNMSISLYVIINVITPASHYTHLDISN